MRRDSSRSGPIVVAWHYVLGRQLFAMNRMKMLIRLTNSSRPPRPPTCQ